MKYAVEMGSGAMIYEYISSYIKIQKLVPWINRHTDSKVIS
jgi:hypothetical protein